MEIPLAPDLRWQEGEEVVLSFRSADVRLGATTPGAGWQGTIVSAVYLGERVECVVEVGAARVRASGPASEPLDKGAVVTLQIAMNAIRAWPAHR
jgi:hypothetical protein